MSINDICSLCQRSLIGFVRKALYIGCLVKLPFYSKDNLKGQPSKNQTREGFQNTVSMIGIPIRACLFMMLMEITLKLEYLINIVLFVETQTN